MTPVSSHALSILGKRASPCQLPSDQINNLEDVKFLLVVKMAESITMRAILFPLTLMIAAITQSEAAVPGLPADSATLALFEFEGHTRDSSGAGRDAVHYGGVFEPARFGMGLTLKLGAAGGIDWSAHAATLRHPFTIEFVFTPKVVSSWGKLFGANDSIDPGWYLKEGGIQAYPDAIQGRNSIEAGRLAYVVVRSSSTETADVFIQGRKAGQTRLQFVAPPAQALFFRDDAASARQEQLRATVEALRISGNSRSDAEIGAVWSALAAAAPSGISARPAPNADATAAIPPVPGIAIINLRPYSNESVDSVSGPIYFEAPYDTYYHPPASKTSRPYVLHSRIAKAMRRNADSGGLDGGAVMGAVRTYLADIQSFRFTAPGCAAAAWGEPCDVTKYAPDTRPLAVQAAVSRGSDGSGRGVVAAGFLPHDFFTSTNFVEDGLVGEFSSASCARGWWGFGLNGQGDITGDVPLVWIRSPAGCSFSTDASALQEFASMRAHLMRVALQAARAGVNRRQTGSGEYVRQCGPSSEVPGLRVCKDVWVPGRTENVRDVPTVAAMDSRLRTTPP
jgi:hypothetical protein